MTFPNFWQDNGLLDRERYVVFNRFQSRDGAGPRFEKRWADRKSSLKVLDGFRFFTLLRRADDVQLNDRPVEYAQGTADYMSMTVWETKKNFNSWRTGYAFKEAHGGGLNCRLPVRCCWQHDGDQDYPCPSRSLLTLVGLF